MRRTVSFALALAVALAWLEGDPLPASAASCGPNPNYCYSLMIGTGTAHESGLSMYFNYPTSTTFHIGDAAHWLNTMYFTTASGHILEMGICLENNDFGCGCGPSGLFEYVAIDALAVACAAIPSDGSWHTFTMQGTSTCHTDNSWYFSDDAGAFYHSNSLGSCWGYVNSVQAGAELAGPSVPDNTQYTVGGFSDYVKVFDSSWHYLSSHTAHIDDPCGSSNCFDGYYFSDNHWGWDKRA